MKAVGVAGIACVALALSACGGGADDDRGSGSSDVVLWRHGEPVKIADQSRPPSKLIVKDIRAGKGPTLRKGLIATLKYRSFGYLTGQRYEDWWSLPFHTSFGEGESLGAWEKGLKGMRVGGRRELIVPAREAYGRVPVIYALELVAVH